MADLRALFDGLGAEDVKTYVQSGNVVFKSADGARARVGKLDPERGKPDEFRLVGQQIYLHCPNGYGRTKLTNAYFEKQLGVAATTRNWKTVTKVAELASS